MSPSQKDPNDDEETNLHARELSASTRGQRENERNATSRQSSSSEETTHSRSDSINGDDNQSRVDQNRPASETGSGRTQIQLSLLGLDSLSTVHSPGKSEMPDTPAAFNSRSRPPSKHAAERDAFNMPPSSDPKKEGCGIVCSSDSGSSSNTESTATDSDISEDQEDCQPPATITIARPTKRKASYARQTGKTWHWAHIVCFSLIFGLIVVAVALAYVTGCESPSIEIQKACDLVFQAGAGVTSAYFWILYATQQLYHRLPAFRTAPRHSSRQQFGAGLGQTYTNLSQALAASDSLFQAPALISEKRAEAMRFRLPEGSLTSEPLHRFLQQSVHVDEDLLRLILSLGQTSSLALRQHHLTTDTLRSIQRVQYFGTFEVLQIHVVGISTQESQLKIRLEQHFRFLDEKITVADRDARKVLQDYITLASTTEEIRQSSLQDQQRLLSIKGQTASQKNWLVRATIQLLGLSEPEDLAKISENVALAQGIHEWAQNVVDLLQRVTSHLKYAKTNIGSLVEIISKHSMITWDVADKDREIMEFLAQISEGVELLDYNTAAWIELQVAGHI